MTELLPCPFCGKPTEYVCEDDHHGDYFRLGCTDEDCPAHWTYYTEPQENAEKCIARWNSRISAPAQAAQEPNEAEIEAWIRILDTEQSRNLVMWRDRALRAERELSEANGKMFAALTAQPPADPVETEEGNYDRSNSEAVAWIAFAGNGNIRLWTADEARAKDEKSRGLDMRAFTLAELVALASKAPTRSSAVSARADRAERALKRAGWTYTDGAEEWKPPLGPTASPLLDEIDRLRNTIELLERNADIQGKLLADTARERDQLRAVPQTSGVWQPIETAPKDGTWIIGICNDHSRLYRMSWGRARDGQLAWCTADGVVTYGDGLFSPFGGWAACPLSRPQSRTGEA